MRMSDWSSDVCSSDLLAGRRFSQELYDDTDFDGIIYMSRITNAECVAVYDRAVTATLDPACPVVELLRLADLVPALMSLRSEEHTSELQSLMRISYAGFCFNKKHINSQHDLNNRQQRHNTRNKQH